MLKIIGTHPNSLIDYPGNIAYMVFTARCNLDCWYCHNRTAMNGDNFINEYDVTKDILSRTGFIDGVVISGGEPTLQDASLEPFIRQLKSKGLKVKLDTNGTRPELVKKYIDIVDYIAMDIKAPQKKYPLITGIANFDFTSIKTSISLLVNQTKIPYEFRTTFTPDLDKTDILEIANLVKGARQFSLQTYRKIPTEKKYPQSAFAPHSAEYIESVFEDCKKITNTVLR